MFMKTRSDSCWSDIQHSKIFDGKKVWSREWSQEIKYSCFVSIWYGFSATNIYTHSMIFERSI